MKLKYFTVFLDGIDKCGKDTIRQLVWLLDKRLNVYARGIISLKAYSKKFNRDCEYVEPFKNAIYVLLDVDKDDWTNRCIISHEEKIDYDSDYKLFEDAYNEMQANYKCLRFNTSKMTPIQIAKAIVEKVKEINEGELNESTSN